MIAKRLSALLVLGLTSGFIGCGGGDLTLPSEGEPATIAIEHGEGQQARVGAALTDSLVVKVTDTQSRPVAGATVDFAFDDASSGGMASPNQAVTDGSGLAWSKLTLGTHVGAAAGHASVQVPEGRVPVTAPFTATALPADANGIVAISGQDQSSAVGTELGEPLVVQVTDGFGNPVKDVAVTWTTEDGGSFSASSTTTGEDGKTSVTWTLGTTAGPQTALASAGQLAGSPVNFHATATAGNAAKVTKVSGDDQRGAPGAELGQPLVVQVLDAQSNPVVGRAVTWVGDGTATPETTTDGQGNASTHWTLSSTPGRNTLNAVVSGVGRATFHATGAAVLVASTTRITSVSPEPSTVGQEVTVAFSVTGAGGTPTGNVTVTATGGSESCTGSVASGSCKITLNDIGNRRITATYGGDSQFSGSSDSKDHQVTAVNNPPVANDDSYSTSEDVGLHVPSGDILGLLVNDSDDGGNLTVRLVAQAIHGQVVITGNAGEFDYTPAQNFSGQDSFTYRIIDAQGAADTATVRITVNPVNDAPQFTKGADQTLSASAGPQTLPNWATSISKGPSDESGQTLTFQVSNDNSGIFAPGREPTVDQGGNLSFTPNPVLSATGAANVTVVLSDNGGTANGGDDTSDPQTFTITVTVP